MPSGWRDLFQAAWDLRLAILIAVMGLVLCGSFVGAMTYAKYAECRAHGFTKAYCL